MVAVSPVKSLSSLALTVTVFGELQFPVAKVRLAGAKVTSVLFDDGVTVTVPVGAVPSATV